MSVFLDAQPVAARDRIAAILSGGVVPMAIMLSLDFADGPLRLCNRRVPFTDLKDGHTWGAGHGLLVSLPDLEMAEDSLNPFRQYQLGLPSDLIDLEEWAPEVISSISDRANYVTREVALYGQIFDPMTGAPVGHPFAHDVAQMDRMTASFSTAGAIVSLSVESFMARQGMPVYGMMTYRDQLRRFPGDEGMQFTTESGRLVTWTKW